MANKEMGTIKFPSSNDTYDIVDKVARTALETSADVVKSNVFSGVNKFTHVATEATDVVNKEYVDQTARTITGNYNIVASDNRTVFEYSSVGNATITFNSDSLDYEKGFEITIVRIGTGNFQIAGGNHVLRNKEFKTASSVQYDTVRIMKTNNHVIVLNWY